MILKSSDFGKLTEEILARGGSFSFKARGSSMVPNIHDGDIITVEPVKESDLNIGTIALYRHAGGKLVAHRIIEKGVLENRTILTMQGDASVGFNEKVKEEQVLGRIVSVQRDNEFTRLERRVRRSKTLVWAIVQPLGPLLFVCLKDVKTRLSRVLISLQSLKLYRKLARKLIGKKIHYRVATAEDSLSLSQFYGYDVFPEKGDPASVRDRQTNLLVSNGNTLIALFRRKIAGAAVLRRFPEDEASRNDCWLFGMVVRTRYRGAGIGEGLVYKALEKAHNEGTNNLNLLVFKRNKPAYNLYKKLGFEQVSIHRPINRFKNNGKLEENHRIIMTKFVRSSSTEKLNNKIYLPLSVYLNLCQGMRLSKKEITGNDSLLKKHSRLRRNNHRLFSDPYDSLLNVSNETLSYLQSVLRHDKQISINQYREVDWHGLLPLMSDNGIIFLFYWLVNQLPTALRPPERISGHLRKVFLSNFARYVRVEKQLDEILRAFQSKGIDALVLRGIGLAHTVYPDFATRPINDFDLLVTPKHFLRARDILNRLGYSCQLKRFEMFGELFNAESFIHQSKTRRYCPVDLHWSLFQYHGLKRDSNVEEFFHRAETVKTTAMEFKTLSTIDALIDAAFHTILHHPEHKRLMWVSDIAFLARHLVHPEEWDKLRKRCSEFKLSLALEKALTLADTWYDLKIPQSFSELIVWLNPTDEEKAEYVYLSQKQGPDIRLRGYLNSFISAHGKIRFIVHFLFPSSTYIRMVYPPPRKWLLPFSYVRRWAHWFVKFFQYGLSAYHIGHTPKQ